MGHFGTLWETLSERHIFIFLLVIFIPELKRSIAGIKSDLNGHKQLQNMDKETLKTLLKENLKVETETYWKFGSWRVVTKILFDDEIISEDFIELDAI